MTAAVGHDRYSVYGYDFVLRGDCQAAQENLAEDFTFFAGEAASVAPVELFLNQGQPDYDGLPEIDASVYTPRNVVYRDGGRRILDFGGRGIGIYEPALRRFTMTSESVDLLYEAAYLFLLSQIGQAADRQGMSRVHAAAMSHNGRAILAMLPMGGGKARWRRHCCSIPTCGSSLMIPPFSTATAASMRFRYGWDYSKGRSRPCRQIRCG